MLLDIVNRSFNWGEGMHGPLYYLHPPYSLALKSISFFGIIVENVFFSIFKEKKQQICPPRLLKIYFTPFPRFLSPDPTDSESIRTLNCCYRLNCRKEIPWHHLFQKLQDPVGNFPMSLDDYASTLPSNIHW